MNYFDDGRLDDEAVLNRYDALLRTQAEAGARVRREALAAEPGLAAATSSVGDTRPRAVVAAGPDSRLLRAVLEPHCPVPFLAWPNPGLPGWAGNLDLVVVLAPQGDDEATARAVAEAVRRGCQLVVACPEGSLVDQHAQGRYSTILPTLSGDQLATAVVMLELLHRLALAPSVDPEVVATALDEVAVECSPGRDLAVNPAKMLAIALADANPLLWGGTVLSARAARRIAESFRRATGRASLAADAEHLIPILEAVRPADVFADPVADGGEDRRPSLVILDDGGADPTSLRDEERLRECATRAGVRIDTISSGVDGDVARYAAMLATGTYAAAYLRVGTTD